MQEVVYAEGRLAPQVIAGEADVCPAERRRVGQEVIGSGMTGCESAWKIDPLTGDIGVQK
jgi:hypothetical protein